VNDAVSSAASRRTRLASVKECDPGAATGDRWRRLRAEADDYARRTNTHAQIVESAVDVFGMFVDWFSEDVDGDRVERRAVVGRTVQH
jgi:hypothetical protein